MPPRVVFACLCLALATGPALAVPESPVRGERTGAAPPANDPTLPSHSPKSDEAAGLSNATPKGALKLLAVALRDGDADRIRQVMYAANPTETRMVAAMAEMARAMAALQKAAVKAFGKDAAKEVVGDTDATDSESKAHIDAAEVKIQGDTATVTMEDGEEAPVVLKRVDGRWRLPMSELSRGADLAALEERLAGLAQQAKLVRELADEVAAHKYASPAQAHEAWQSRAMQASMQRAPRVEKKPDAARARDGQPKKRIEDRG
jgi:hypothetical protein